MLLLTTIFMFAQLAVSTSYAQTEDISRRRVSNDTSAVGKQPTVQTLAVQITTRDLRGAGTDNAIFFDVGPWAWRLNNSWRNDFERGRTDTFNLKVPEGFSLSDIIWLRLHKKGLLGVTGTSDSLTGAWHPQRISLFVDGAEYTSAEVNTPLNSRYWFWTKLRDFDPYANPASFALSLRLKPNDKLPWLAKATGFFTTPLFKKRGISGWIDYPEQKASAASDKPSSQPPAIVCATGEAFRSPALSTDGLATIDLTLEALEFCSETLQCHQRAELYEGQAPKRRRYLRIEYRYRHNRVPDKAKRVRICGRLRWDTDREGWWEIHPRNDIDIEFLTKRN